MEFSKVLSRHGKSGDLVIFWVKSWNVREFCFEHAEILVILFSMEYLMRVRPREVLFHEVYA